MSCQGKINENPNIVVKEDNNGVVSVYVPDNTGVLKPFNLGKECCELISVTYYFDENEQKCRYKPQPTCDTINSFKIKLNPNGNEAVLFNVDENESCSLKIEFDYLFKISCATLKELWETQVSNNPIASQVNQLTEDINNQTVLCETITNQISVLEEQINQTPYSIVCGASVTNNGNTNVNTNNYNFQSNGYSTNTSSSNVTTGLSGNFQNQTGISAEQLAGTYCFTELGLSAWANLLGPTRYDLYLNGYESSYDCNDVTNILSLNNASLTPLLYECEVPFGTKSNLIAEKNVLETQLGNCNDQLNLYINELNDLLENNTIDTNICEKPINFLENLDVSMTIDVVEPNNITTVYEKSVFPIIGSGNLYQYFLETKDFTGFYVYDTQSGNPVMIKDGSFGTCKSIPENLLTELHLQSGLSFEDFKNSISDNVLASNLLSFSTLIDDENTLDLFKNKNIVLSIKINNTCGDLCVLLDNIKLEKECSKLDKTNIFITECPGFKLEKLVDNKKSWLNNTIQTNRDFKILNNVGSSPIRLTNYSSDDDRLILNTKEIDLNINIGLAVESDVFSYVVNNPCILTGQTNCRVPCEDVCCGDNRISFDKLATKDLSSVNSVEEFKYYLISELIDVKNRQTISSYATLRALYDRYLNSQFYCSNVSSTFNYLTIDEFSKLINEYWYDLIEQVIPATTIWGAVKIYSNTLFDQQKYRYRTYTSLLCNNNFSGIKVPSPINGTSGLTQTVDVVITPITSGVTLTSSVCGEISVSQMNFGSEFVGRVSCLGQDCVGFQNNNSIVILNEG
jgi:hypothetical protein